MDIWENLTLIIDSSNDRSIKPIKHKDWCPFFNLQETWTLTKNTDDKECLNFATFNFLGFVGNEKIEVFWKVLLLLVIMKY